tara:strand:+ start:84 stop:353 length:270 start_codon:yes stop_codon:yes gene_type:complete
MEPKKSNFLDTANSIKRKHIANERKLKLEKALEHFEATNQKDIAEEIKAVCEDLTFTNRVIHKALEEFDIILSESAVRRYRVKYGIVEE